jgi:hypothetical protein
MVCASEATAYFCRSIAKHKEEEMPYDRKTGDFVENTHTEATDGPTDFHVMAQEYVYDYVDDHLEKTDEKPSYEVYVVWFCKTLQHWKALLSTTLPDGMYYEVTYNGDKKEAYIDAYKKFKNVVVKG